MLWGVDVSVYQEPSDIPEDVDFAVVRATYGVRADKDAARHVEHCRARNIRVALYHFVRPDQDQQAQLEAFESVADACSLSWGDGIPWLDVEAYPIGGGRWEQPMRSWVPVLERLHELFRDRWGLVGQYDTQRDWTLLGRPSWMIDVPRWAAHWRTSHGEIATPGGNPWEMHQYRVGPYKRGALHVLGEHTAPNAIDHNRAREWLTIPRPELRHGPTLTQRGPIVELDWAAFRAHRDAVIRAQIAGAQLHEMSAADAENTLTGRVEKRCNDGLAT